jgi:hypothetical protein
VGLRAGSSWEAAADTDETAECWGRWYSRSIGTSGWTNCHAWKQPLKWKPSQPGKLISKQALREMERAEFRRRGERREREKAEHRHAKQAAAIRERCPLFAEQLIEALSARNK